MAGQILVVGSINMDIVTRSQKLPKTGETVSGQSISYIPGGKGTNQAIAASRLGGQVALIGLVGQDEPGTSLIHFLRQENLNIDSVRQISGSSGTAIVNVDQDGNNQIIVIPGANALLDSTYLKFTNNIFKISSIILSQLEIPVTTVDLLFHHAKKYHKTTILNPSPTNTVPPSLFKNTDYLVVNEIELSFFSHLNYVPTQIDQIKLALHKLHQQGPHTVIVTLGAQGLICLSESNFIHLPGHQVRTVDTTAAGDCFMGAFATSLSQQASLRHSLEFANLAASLSVQHPGASSSLPYLSDLPKKNADPHFHKNENESPHQ